MSSSRQIASRVLWGHAEALHPIRGTVRPWMPGWEGSPRTLGRQPISHPKAPPLLTADPRSGAGLVKDTHAEELAPRATQKAWA